MTMIDRENWLVGDVVTLAVPGIKKRYAILYVGQDHLADLLCFEAFDNGKRRSDFEPYIARGQARINFEFELRPQKHG